MTTINSVNTRMLLCCANVLITVFIYLIFYISNELGRCKLYELRYIFTFHGTTGDPSSIHSRWAHHSTLADHGVGEWLVGGGKNWSSVTFPPPIGTQTGPTKRRLGHRHDNVVARPLRGKKRLVHFLHKVNSSRKRHVMTLL